MTQQSNRRQSDHVRLIDILERGPGPDLRSVAVYVTCLLVGSVCLLGAFAVTFVFLLMLEPPQ